MTPVFRKPQVSLDLRIEQLVDEVGRHEPSTIDQLAAALRWKRSVVRHVVDVCVEMGFLSKARPPAARPRRMGRPPDYYELG